MDAFGRQNMRLDRLDQRHQRRGAGPDPIGERRDIEIDAFFFVYGALAVQRQMGAIFAEQHLGQELRSSAAARDRMRGSGRLRDRFAGAAGELFPHMLDHFPLRRHEFERLGDVLAQFAQHAAAARALRCRWFEDALARQLRGQRAASRFQFGRRRGWRGDFGGGPILADGLHEIDQLQFELIEQSAASLR